MSDKLKITERKISEFTQDPSNANQGDERGLRILDDSLAETGLGRSVVVDKNDILIAGNKTTERAIDRGFNDAIVIETTGDKLVIVKRTDLDLMSDDPNNPARKMAYFDNRASEFVAWDAEQLLADINAGVDLSRLFTAGELDELLAGIKELDSPGDPGFNYQSQYGVIVVCDSEAHQQEVYEDLKEMGLNARVVVT